VTLDKSIPQNMAILAPFFFTKISLHELPWIFIFSTKWQKIAPKKKKNHWSRSLHQCVTPWSETSGF
jgi:hypothetical protein